MSRQIWGVVRFSLYNSKYSYSHTIYKNKKRYYVYDDKNRLLIVVEIDLEKLQQYLKLKYPP